MNRPPPPPLVFYGPDLRPGRGVADHARTLADALAAQGRPCLLVDRPRPVPPADWVVIEFVAYGWNRRGLLGPADFADLLAAGTGRRVALFFHELWLGENRRAPLRHVLLGALQRGRILRLLARLRPALVLTSNAAYQAVLAGQGIPAELLPLPGNLPAPDATDRAEAGRLLAATTPGATRRAVVFGSIHEEWDPLAALDEWRALGTGSALLVVGDSGVAGPGRLAALRRARPDLRIATTGRVPAGVAAALLAGAEVAFATSPWALIDKSGTAAAFRDLGLPVVVTRDDWAWRRGPTPAPTSDPLVRLWRAGGFDWPALLAARRTPRESAPAIARRLLALLGAAA
jgi:hypothetical protein